DETRGVIFVCVFFSISDGRQHVCTGNGSFTLSFGGAQFHCSDFRSDRAYFPRIHVLVSPFVPGTIGQTLVEGEFRTHNPDCPCSACRTQAGYSVFVTHVISQGLKNDSDIEISCRHRLISDLHVP
ncbi:unnamed protein product, partial [Ectocarpus sp. 4 AP-2014]